MIPNLDEMVFKMGRRVERVRCMERATGKIILPYVK